MMIFLNIVNLILRITYILTFWRPFNIVTCKDILYLVRLDDL